MNRAAKLLRALNHVRHSLTHPLPAFACRERSGLLLRAPASTSPAEGPPCTRRCVFHSTAAGGCRCSTSSLQVSWRRGQFPCTVSSALLSLLLICAPAVPTPTVGGRGPPRVCPGAAQPRSERQQPRGGARFHSTPYRLPGRERGCFEAATGKRRRRERAQGQKA